MQIFCFAFPRIAPRFFKTQYTSWFPTLKMKISKISTKCLNTSDFVTQEIKDIAPRGKKVYFLYIKYYFYANLKPNQAGKCGKKILEICNHIYNVNANYIKSSVNMSKSILRHSSTVRVFDWLNFSWQRRIFFCGLLIFICIKKCDIHITSISLFCL